MSPVTSCSSDKLQKIKEKNFVLAKFSLCCYKYVRLKKSLMTLLIIIRKMRNKLEKNSIIFFLGKSLRKKGVKSKFV